MVTKGYGLTIDNIDWSCPADLEPYAKAYTAEIKKQDEQMWMMGMYIVSALDSTVCNSELWRKKGVKPHEYIKKPFLQDLEEKTKAIELTEEEKQREVDLFFKRENARRLRWQRNKKRQGIEND